MAHTNEGRQTADGVKLAATHLTAITLVCAAERVRRRRIALTQLLRFVVDWNDFDEFRVGLAHFSRHLDIVADDDHLLRRTDDCVMHNTCDRLSLVSNSI